MNAHLELDLWLLLVFSFECQLLHFPAAVVVAVVVFVIICDCVVVIAGNKRVLVVTL